MNKKKIVIIVVEAMALFILLATAWVVIPGNYRYITKTPAERRAQKKEWQNRRAYSAYLDGWLEENRVASDKFLALKGKSLGSLHAQYKKNSDSLFQKALRCYDAAGKWNNMICEIDSLLVSGTTSLDTNALMAQRRDYEKKYNGLILAARFCLDEEHRLWEVYEHKSDSIWAIPYVQTDMLDFGQFVAARESGKGSK